MTKLPKLVLLSFQNIAHLLGHFLAHYSNNFDHNSKNKLSENCFFISFRTVLVFLDQKRKLVTLERLEVCMSLTGTEPDSVYIFHLVTLNIVSLSFKINGDFRHNCRTIYDSTAT